MAIVLPKQPSLGEITGASLGQGLQALVENKLRQVQERNDLQKREQSYEQFFPEQQKGMARALAALPEAERKIALKHLFAAPGGQGGIGGPAENLTRDQREARKLENSEMKEARKYLEPYEETYLQAKRNIDENNQLIALAKKGNLRAGTSQQILDKLGLGTFWQPKDNELASKTIARMAQNAGAAFNTSRLTNLDVNLYKNSLGTLWNTPEGLEAIAKINKLESKALKTRHDARRQIIREERGRVPFDIEQRIDERVETRLKDLAQRSMDIVTGTKPSGNSNFNTLKSALRYARPGQTITDKETGKKYSWDGKEIKEQ